MIAGVRWIRRLASQPAFASWGIDETLPGPGVVTPDEIEADLRARAFSNMHAAGTCRMGPKITSVIDPDLRVHGIDRLRVADASVMPRIVSGNTNAPTIMISEKAAELIIADANA
jgi:choline dehydrogenase